MPRLLKAPASLHARLLLIAAVTTLLALGFAAYSVGNVLERFVRRNLDQLLTTQITGLAGSIGKDGAFDRSKLVEIAGFRDRAPGWGWRVTTKRGEWLGGERFVEQRIWDQRRERRRRRSPSFPGIGRTRSGETVFLRQLKWQVASAPATITVAVPRRIVDRPIRGALPPLLISLGVLGLGLALATWTQLRYGLRPLRSLSAAIARVRSGTLDRLPLDYPTELRPLALEVNALIDQNEAGLDHARRHVANLAHGLKTPLATLALQLDRDGASAETRALVAQLDQRIAHHLRRARSAAPGATARTRTRIGEVVSDLLVALRRVHVDRALTFEERLDPELWVAIDRQDLDEMLGNLLDNACRHAASHIRISAQVRDAEALILVEDDGPGMSETDVTRALRPGQRLDESGIGYGFGLAIVTELAELYGGRFDLERSGDLQGLSAVLALPLR